MGVIEKLFWRTKLGREIKDFLPEIITALGAASSSLQITDHFKESSRLERLRQFFMRLLAKSIR